MRSKLCPQGLPFVGAVCSEVRIVIVQLDPSEKPSHGFSEPQPECARATGQSANVAKRNRPSRSVVAIREDATLRIGTICDGVISVEGMVEKPLPEG
jgi:hypothetical protein